ncbi:AraC family transcriptional regulator [Marinilactibacillus kalidii]|uniref:AraC family transcriptional regulator n=1 Tax=Marinilactibacillus kalidii TaxID=2820274 RepID=UPI001FCA2C36
MYSGTSEQVINGVPVTLKEGQLLLLDTNSQHELLPLGQNDILLNFLFKTKDININLLKKIDNRSVGLTFNFLMNAILEPGYNETHLILDLSREPKIQVTLDQMILEFYSNKHLGNEVMNAFSQVLFLQLSRVYHSQLIKIYQKDGQSNLMLRILQQIESNYKTLTLTQLGHELGYNANYLSNLIKQQTGNTFKKLVIDQRLHEAHNLVLSTRLTIETISEYVGFSNKTQFYKKYREHFGDTPINIRKQR